VFVVQLLRFIAVAILVGCSFCVAQFGPYDIKWHAEKKIDVPEFDCSSAGVICDPGLDHYIDPSIYENSKCILLIGYDYSFLSLGASFGAVAANAIMKSLDYTDRLYCGIAYPHDSLYARKLLGRIEMDSIPAVDELPVIDEKYFVYKAPENEFRDEKPERPKTIPAGFHNPTILIGSEDRTNVNEAMSKVEKGLCYGSIAAMILSGGNIPVLCEQHGLH
jgi:hypothetical protein